MGNTKYINILIMFFLLIGCNATLPLNVQESENNYFSPDKKVYIEARSETVKLSSRLKWKLIEANFSVTDTKEDAGYILRFDYNAKFDVLPWVFNSLDVTLSDSDSGDIVYQITSTDSGSEPVQSVINRVVHDMSTRLLLNQEKGIIALIVLKTKN